MHGYQVVAVGSGEGAAYLIGLRGTHPGHVGDQLHHLLLPDYYPVAPFQSPALQRMIIVPLGPVPVPVNELGHGAPLHPDALA